MYHIDTQLLFCFHEYCLSVVIIGHFWDVTIILCCCGANGGSTLFTLACPCINGATKVTQYHLHGYRHPNLLVAHFNHWHVDFISGLSSCENQPLSCWLIVELRSLFWVKNGLIRNLLFVAYSIPLGCYVSWPSLDLEKTVWVMFLEDYLWRTRVA
jgi:hypothetical protein